MKRLFVIVVFSFSLSLGQVVLPGAAAVKTALTFTEAEVLQMAGLTSGGTVRKAVTWGTRVPYAGALLVGGAAIYGALDWFYQQAQNAASGSSELDDWYHNNLQVAMQLNPVSNVNNSTECGSLGGRQYTWQVQAAISSGAPPSSFATVRSCAPPNQSMLAEYRATLIAPGYPYAGQSLTGWLETPGGYKRYFARESLNSLINRSPSARAAVRNALNQYYQQQNPQRGMSPAPYSAFELETPTKNQWADDPAKDKSEDLDGDGWSDYQESINVPPTNPNDNASVPAPAPTTGVDPNSPAGDKDNDGWTNAQEEAYGTNPNDANSQPEPQENCNAGFVMSGGGCVPIAEIPEDIATETTLSRVAGQAEIQTQIQGDILEELRKTEEIDTPFDFGTPEAFPTPDFTDLRQYEPDVSPLEQVYTEALVSLETDVDSIFTAAQEKFPFGLVAALDDLPSSVPSATCPNFSLHVGGQQRQVDICNNPADTWASTKGKALLSVFMSVMFVWWLLDKGANA